MKCVICGNRRLQHYKTVHSVAIKRCPLSDLLITKRSKVLHKKQLYSPNSIYSEQLYQSQFNQHLKKVNFIQKYIYSQFKNYVSVLEIGGGYGLLSQQMAKRGKLVTLVEPNLRPLYAQQNLNIQVKRQSAHTFLKRNRKKFDLVILVDVIEHFNNPIVLLSDIKKHLAVNGRICIVTPNFRSIMQYMSYDWAWWMVEDHRVHFSPLSIKKLMSKAGYVFEAYTTFEMSYDYFKNTEGTYQRIHNPLLRKGLKLVLFYPSLFIYHLLRPYIWTTKRGGLHLALIKAK